MASVEKRGDSYRITVSCGYSADGSRQIKQSMTWKPSKPNLTQKQLEKQLQAAAAEFEQRCKSEGTVVASVKFEPFCEAYLNDVASRTLKPSTLSYYEQLKPRVYSQIGHLRLDRITPREIDKLIAFLCKERKSAKTVAVCKVDFRNLIQQHGYSQKRLAHDAGTSQQTLKDFGNGKPILQTTGEKIAALLECDAEMIFEKIEKTQGLSPKTIKNYVSFTSAIFDYAVRTRIIAHNPCEHCTLPTLTEPDRKMLSLDEADRFLDILETAPLKFQAFFKLALYGGFRAGEILGLQWNDIDFRLNIVQIKRTAHYSKALGHYCTTPKTKSSNRILKLPEHVLDTLQKLQVEQRNLYEFGGRSVERGNANIHDRQICSDEFFDVFKLVQTNRRKERFTARFVAQLPTSECKPFNQQRRGYCNSIVDTRTRSNDNNAKRLRSRFPKSTRRSARGGRRRTR